MSIYKENKDLEIFEALIDENLPRDLAAAYKSSTAYDSQRNPLTQHREINNNKRRRYVKYDYGKSSYEPITPDAAIQLVKDNKYNIQKLRIIYDGELVEFEVRDNGGIYSIYGNTSKEVVVDDKTYKNIRYVPWRKVLQNADKIYLTDEYDHLIYDDPATQVRRDNNSEIIRLGSIPHKDTPGFDPHKPFNNFKLSEIELPQQFDSGAHDIDRRYRDFASKDLQQFIEAIKEMKTLYTGYDLARRYLKKLISEKDDYEEDDYERLLTKANNAVQDRLTAYNVIAKKVSNLKSKIVTNVDTTTASINRKIQEYLRKLQDLLDKGYSLKQQFDDLLVRNVNKDLDSDYEGKRLRKQIEQNLKSIKQVQKELEDMRDENASETPNDPPAILDLAARVDADLNRLDEIKNMYINRQLKKFKEIEDELAQIDRDLAILKPKAAARKAAKAAKNRTPELDPALADIVQFTDFTQDIM